MSSADSKHPVLSRSDRVLPLEAQSSTRLTSSRYEQDHWNGYYCHTVMRSWLIISTFLNITPFPRAVEGSVLLSSDVSRPETFSNATSNETTSTPKTLPTHALRAVDISCDGSRYGWDLPERSCIDVLVVMEEDPRMRTFGPRGLGAWDYPLPQRLVSSKAITRGCLDTC